MMLLNPSYRENWDITGEIGSLFLDFPANIEWIDKTGWLWLQNFDLAIILKPFTRQCKETSLGFPQKEMFNIYSFQDNSSYFLFWDKLSHPPLTSSGNSIALGDRVCQATSHLIHLKTSSLNQAQPCSNLRVRVWWTFVPSKTERTCLIILNLLDHMF